MQEQNPRIYSEMMGKEKICLDRQKFQKCSGEYVNVLTNLMLFRSFSKICAVEFVDYRSTGYFNCDKVV